MKYLSNYIPKAESGGYVVIEEDGVLKAQKLTFDGTTATPSGEAEIITDTGLFPTGMDEPAYNGGGGGETKFYKCASVDTTTQTWSGYELVLTDGVYSVSKTLTSGLSYTSITPVAGTVYSQDALVKVASYAQNMPTDGLVFYAPLSAYSTTAETGQTLTTNGITQYLTFKGIPCVDLNGSSYISSLIAGVSQTGTLCLWAYLTVSGSKIRFVHIMDKQSVREFSLSYWDGSFAWGSDFQLSDILNKWVFFTLTLQDSSVRVYVNGIYSGEFSVNSAATEFTDLCIGWDEYYAESGTKFEGCMSSVRVYDRVLTQDEITALTSEFTPTE